nr:Kv channel-interacting protein 4-like [Penaeus vannamei]
MKRCLGYILMTTMAYAMVTYYFMNLQISDHSFRSNVMSEPSDTQNIPWWREALCKGTDQQGARMLELPWLQRDVEPPASDNNIFLVETACKTTPSFRVWCAIERRLSTAGRKPTQQQVAKRRLQGFEDSQKKISNSQDPWGHVTNSFGCCDDDGGDGLSFHVQRYRPEELEKLAKTTKFSKKEIQLIYRGFKQECPTGLIDEEGFKEIFSQFFPLGDATHYAHYVFNTFTRNHHGQISFEDFLASLSTVSRGTTQEKLQWIFGLYDVNNDGLITKAEMVDVVSAIYEMMGRSTEPQVEETSAKEHVEKIFHLIDANQDGAITIEELAQWVSRDDTIIQSLSMMDTVLYTRREAASSPPTHPPSPPTHPSSPPTHPSQSQP